MQNSTMNREISVTETESERRNLKKVLTDLKGSIFFEKTLKRTNARNLERNRSELGIPRWFIESHGEKLREIVYLIAGPTTRTWTVRIHIKVPKLVKKKVPQIQFLGGWNEFANFHGLVENDRLIFSLKAMSNFEVYIFHRTGEPKESSFPTSRKPSIEVHGLSQKKGYEKSRKRKPTARKRATREKDAIPSQKPLGSALHLFKPHILQSIPVQSRRFPEVIGQEPSDDVHQELVMPFTKNSRAGDFVEKKITFVGDVNKIQAQIQSQISSPSFLSPSTFRNFNNLEGNMRVHTVVVLNGIPEMNGEAGDRASNLLPVVQSDPSAVVQSDPSAVVQSDASAVVKSVPSALVQSDPSAVVRSVPSAVVQSDPSAVVQPLELESRRESEQPIVTVPSANGGIRRKHHRPWTLGEVMALVECVARCGVGKWAEIKKLGFSPVGYRTVVDLKDKWRNLLRASQAQLHPAKQGERKKQFTTSVPSPILARVRELASLPNQIPSGTVYVDSTSSKWRIVHRK